MRVSVQIAGGILLALLVVMALSFVVMKTSSLNDQGQSGQVFEVTTNMP